jgi:acetylornithine deacetylase/succinyl-diaminopimelate desuccinylase-like protein
MYRGACLGGPLGVLEEDGAKVGTCHLRRPGSARKSALTLLEQLVAIPTWEGTEERKALLYLQTWLQEYGIESAIYEGNDAYALVSTFAPRGQKNRSDGVAPPLIFNSHIDTVPPSNLQEWRYPPLCMTHEGDKVLGLGVADAKGCVAAMAAAYVALHAECEVSSEIQLMIVSGEESGGRGTSLQAKRGMFGAAVVGEPTTLVACIATKGVVRIDVTAYGKAAHASQPRAGRNAIYPMAALVKRLEELAEEVTGRAERWTGHSSLAVTLIEGGNAENIVAPTCSIHIDRRLVPGESADQAQTEIQSIVDEVAREYPGIRFDLERRRFLLPVMTSQDEKIARCAIATTNAQPQGFTACCDLSLITHEGGIPGVILGPGSLDQAHQVNESLHLVELERGVDLYMALAKEWGKCWS